MDRFGRAIAFPGGGNLLPIYPNSIAVLERTTPKTPGVILPHTMRGIAALLRQRPQIVAIAREPASASHLVRGGVPPSQIRLAHDLAFSLGDLVQHSDGEQGDGTLVALRRDTERWCEGGDHARNSFDVSAQRNSAWTDLAESHDWASSLLRFVATYRFVVTDRLHVAIAASLLARECWILPNVYGKNRDVFEYSMRRQYPHVTWCEDFGDVPDHALRGTLPRDVHLARWEQCRPVHPRAQGRGAAAIRAEVRRATDLLPPPFGRSAPLPQRFGIPRPSAQTLMAIAPWADQCSGSDLHLLDRELKRVRRRGHAAQLLVLDGSTAGDGLPTCDGLGARLSAALSPTTGYTVVAVLATRRHPAALRTVFEALDNNPRARVLVGEDLAVFSPPDHEGHGSLGLSDSGAVLGSESSDER